MAVQQRTQLTQPRPDLASAFQEFDLEGDRLGMVGHRIFPVIEVHKSFGKFPILRLSDLLQEEETLRNIDGSYNAVNVKGDQGQYTCTEHGLEARVDAREDASFEEWYDAEELAAGIALDRTLRAYERRCMTLVDAVTNTTAAGTAWSNKSSATPYANVLEAKYEVRSRTGIMPDCIAMDVEAFDNLVNTNDMMDRMFGSNAPERAAQATPAMVAAALGLSHCFVAKSVTNTANEGQTATPGSMWTRTQALVFKGGEPGGRISDLRRPRLACTMHWSLDGSRVGGLVEEYDDPVRRGKVMRARHDTDEILLYNSLGERITGVLS